MTNKDEPMYRITEEGPSQRILLSPAGRATWLLIEKGYPLARPDGLDAILIDWPDVGLTIPWPAGMTALEAVEAWKTGLAVEVGQRLGKWLAQQITKKAGIEVSEAVGKAEGSPQ